jgi:hypothetical protein
VNLAYERGDQKAIENTVRLPVESVN